MVAQEDPEKRIAELERQLAAQRRGAVLPPASPELAAASGRFMAFPAPPGTKQMYKFMYGSIAAYMALSIPGCHSRCDAGAEIWHEGLYPASGIRIRPPRGWRDHPLSAVPPASFGRADRRKQILLCVTGDGLTVDQRPGDVFHSSMRSWAYGFLRGSSI